MSGTSRRANHVASNAPPGLGPAFAPDMAEGKRGDATMSANLKSCYTALAVTTTWYVDPGLDCQMSASTRLDTGVTACSNTARDRVLGSEVAKLPARQRRIEYSAGLTSSLSMR